MRVRNIDKNNDWTFGQSQLNYAKQAYAVALDIKLRLQEWYRDCYSALQKGIPWDVRLGAKNQKTLLDNDILRIARETQGVLEIYDFVSEVVGRNYTCSFKVYQQYSTELLEIQFDSRNIGL